MPGAPPAPGGRRSPRRPRRPTPAAQDVPETTHFAPHVRYEIGAFGWHIIQHLPATFVESKQARRRRSFARVQGACRGCPPPTCVWLSSPQAFVNDDGGRHKFYNVWPYIKPLRAWIDRCAGCSGCLHWQCRLRARALVGHCAELCVHRKRREQKGSRQRTKRATPVAVPVSAAAAATVAAAAATAAAAAVATAVHATLSQGEGMPAAAAAIAAPSGAALLNFKFDMSGILQHFALAG